MILKCVSSERNISVFYQDASSHRTSVAEANPFQSETIWWISRVLVQPALRGKGLGTRLLRRLIKEIQKQGAEAIIVAPGGYNANHNKQINFYVKNGFREIDPDGLYRLELGGLDAACSEGG